MKTVFNYKIYFLLVLMIGCVHKADKINVQPINFKDTIHQIAISLFEGGDTLKKYYTIYFAPVDLTIDTSNFFYTACTTPCTNENIYKIYFSRKKVVEFCDSMLHSFPSNSPNELDEYFNAKVVYNAIKENAARDKTGEGVYASELSILLDRFSPLILNPTNGDRPSHIIIINEDNRPGGEYKSYNFKTATGDTVFIDGITIRGIEIQLPDDQ